MQPMLLPSRGRLTAPAQAGVFRGPQATSPIS